LEDTILLRSGNCLKLLMFGGPAGSEVAAAPISVGPCGEFLFLEVMKVNRKVLPDRTVIGIIAVSPGTAGPIVTSISMRT
jgi:hypothetical protein